jgi:hypothetical protein
MEDNILQKINSTTKCVSVTASGIKVYDKRIDIANILKLYSLQSSIPAKEEFEFFDFEGAEGIAREEYNLKLNRLKEDGLLDGDKKYLELEEALEKTLNKIEKYKNEYNNLKIMCKEVKEIVEESKLLYTTDFIESIKLILTKNLSILSRKLKVKVKVEVNEKVLDESINFLKIVLEKNILNELKRHDVKKDVSEQGEVNAEINTLIDEKLKNISNAGSMVKSVYPKLNYVLDIAEETLEFEELKAKLIAFLNKNGEGDLAKELD